MDPSLAIEAEQRDGTGWIRLRGEVDVTAERLLPAALARVAGTSRVVVDLGEVRFLDVRGLAALVTLREAVEAGGSVFEVMPPPRAARRVVVLLGLDEVVPAAADGDERG